MGYPFLSASQHSLGIRVSEHSLSYIPLLFTQCQPIALSPPPPLSPALPLILPSLLFFILPSSLFPPPLLYLLFTSTETLMYCDVKFRVMDQDRIKIMHCIGIITLLLLMAFPGVVDGDGMVIAEPKVHRLLRENRQLAYISVQDDQETMDLFINVVSLRPGENITILVPLRTNPIRASVTEANDTGFRKEFGFDGIIQEGERQSEGVETFIDKFFGYSAEEMAKYLLVGGMLKWVGESDLMLNSGIGGSDDDDLSVQRIYDNPGFSVDLATFGTEGSMAAYAESLNISLPPGVEEVIARYSNYSIAVINMTTRPPISESRYWDLMDATPDAINQLIEFIADHPTVTITGEPPAERFMHRDYSSAFEEITTAFSEERNAWAEANNISEMEMDRLTNSFHVFAATAYGYGKMYGYALSIDLPLFEDRAFFPLGTTYSWNGTDQVEVIFECEEDREIEFGEEPDLECIADGSHYFIFRYTGTQPDHDLEGEYGAELSGWKEMKFRVNGFFYDDAGMKGIILWGVFLIIAIWYFVKLKYVLDGQPVKKRRLLVWTLSCLALSLIGPLGIFCIVVYHDIWFYKEKSQFSELEKKDLAKIREMGIKDFETLFRFVMKENYLWKRWEFINYLFWFSVIIVFFIGYSFPIVLDEEPLSDHFGIFSLLAIQLLICIPPMILSLRSQQKLFQERMEFILKTSDSASPIPPDTQ